MSATQDMVVNHTESLVAAALTYAMGCAVVPIYEPTADGCSCKAGPECTSAGKHPRVKWPAGPRADRRQIRLWWARWPMANVGIITGEISNVLVLDIDPDHGGGESLAKLERQHGNLPATLTSRTGSGGLHHVFSHPGVRIGPSAGKLGPGLDIRGDRGLIVAPPSLHASGQRYHWIDPQARIVAPPAWFVDALRPTPTPPAIQRRRMVVLPGGRYARAALAGEIEAIRKAPVGDRNTSLYRAAFKLGTLVGAELLEAPVVAQSLLIAAIDAGLGETESRDTIKSGLKGGVTVPRTGVSA